LTKNRFGLRYVRVREERKRRGRNFVGGAREWEELCVMAGNSLRLFRFLIPAGIKKGCRKQP